MNSNIVFACFVIAGAIYREYICLVKFIKMFIKNKLLIIFQVINPVVLVSLFFMLNLYINFGQFRLFTILAFIFGYVLYSVTFCKILDNLHKVIYNKLTMIDGIKYTKLGKFILK